MIYFDEKNLTKILLMSFKYASIWRQQLPTVGADKNETLVFLNFSAQGASILKISVAIMKRRS